MAILEKEVWVLLNAKYIKYFEELNYYIPRIKNNRGKTTVQKGTKIVVKVEDLQENSEIKITKICDECGNITPKLSYRSIVKSRKNGDGKDRCKKCAAKNRWITEQDNIKYEQSLEYYINENKMEYLLEEFSDKNKDVPSEIFKRSRNVYLWNCSKCKNEFTSDVNQRTRAHTNCPYCCVPSKRIKIGFNDLWTTHPDIAKLLKDKNRGYEITAGRNKKEEFNCKNCGYISKKIIRDVIKKGYSCSRCSDGISYPEKFMISLLNQLNIVYETQKTFNWSKKIYHLNPQYEKLTGMKKYDFYIPSLNLIIETHGGQHYLEGFENVGNRTQGEENENDDLKMYLALNNGIKHYVIIDCRKSELEWIKNKLLKSKLNTMFDLSNINWLKCHENACNSLIKTTCDIWMHETKSTIEIAEKLRVARSTIIKYLKQGSLLGWCNYDPKEVKIEKAIKMGKGNSKEIIQLSLNGQVIKKWESIVKASKELNIIAYGITMACRGQQKTAGGFKWMYKEEYNKLIQ